MNFCPDCETYLTAQIKEPMPGKDASKGILTYLCRNCGYEEHVDVDKESSKKCVLSNRYDVRNIKIFQYNLKYLEYDPSIPHVNNIPCPTGSCPSNKTTLMGLQGESVSNGIRPVGGAGAAGASEAVASDITVGEGRNIAKGDVLYISLNDEDMTFLYKCCLCGSTWTNK